MNKLKLRTFFVVIFLVLCGLPIFSGESIGASSLTITSPAGGETLYQKESYSIFWTSQDIGDYVKIELCKNGITYYTITTYTANDGVFQWEVPTSISGSGFYIRIADASDDSIYNVSGIFDIKPQYIVVTSPSSSSVWYKGESYTIRWDSDIASSGVNIYCVSGYTEYVIDSHILNRGSYSWVVPASIPSGGSYRIKIVSTTNSDVYDYSSYFRIDEKPIIVHTPTYGDILRTGKTYTISWEGGASNGYVDIYLERGNSLIHLFQTKNDGSYSWTVSKNYYTSTNNRIVIYSTSDTSNYDYSGTFTIRREIIYITSPYENDKWYRGKTNTIRWTSENAGEYLEISLYKNGEYFLTIDSNAYNTGSYSWMVPLDIEIDSFYQIKISSLSTSDLYDFSDYFTIDEQYIKVISPAENSVWYKGNIYQIQWQSKNIGGNVTIELFCSSSYSEKPYSYSYEISSKTYNDGNFSWKIPNDLSTKRVYRIKIREYSSSSYLYSKELVYGYSGNFSINESITILSLSDFETWTVGKSYYINWSAADVVGEYVKIEVLKENEEYFTIAENTNNDGSFLWEIPDSVEPGDFYKIKISSSLKPDVYGISEGYVRIREKPIIEFEVNSFLVSAVGLIVVVIIIFAAIKTWKKNKNKDSGDISKIEEEKDQFIPPQEMKTYDISDEEYERIWEKSKY